MSWQELTQGGNIGGQHLDPVTFLLTQLAAHYAPFGEEQRVSGMTELMSFHRLPNERTDALVARYRTLRWRAAQGGGDRALRPRPGHQARGSRGPHQQDRGCLSGWRNGGVL